jgi:hypothetical protein
LGRSPGFHLLQLRKEILTLLPQNGGTRNRGLVIGRKEPLPKLGFALALELSELIVGKP